MISRRLVLVGLANLPFVISHANAAQRFRLRIAHTSSSDWSSMFIAREDKLFDVRAIDAEFVLVPVSSAVPAAVQSGSVQIGGTTPPTFLQAVDSGLDLVAIAGASVTGNRGRERETAKYVVRREGVKIEKPSDFSGKKVGTPGFGSVLDILFRTWLLEKGVDVASVRWIETAFPSQADVLRGGSVDAVVTAEPILTRIVSQGIGDAYTFVTEVAPSQSLMTLYVTTRDFAEKNRTAISAFRSALEEAAPRVEANLDRSREITAKILATPPEISRAMTFTVQQPQVSPQQIRWWIDLMDKQRMLRSRLDPSRLIAT